MGTGTHHSSACTAGWERPAQRQHRIRRCAPHPPPSLLPTASPLSCGPSVLASLKRQHQSLGRLQASASEAMVALSSETVVPGSGELPQLWVQGELERGQHVCASTARAEQEASRGNKSPADEPRGGNDCA